MIDKYNMYTGGIDTSDQMLLCYLDERRTLKDWRKVTFNIMARMVLKVIYLLYKENNGGKILSRYDYIAEIIDELADEWLASRNGNAMPMGGGDGIGQECGIDHLPGRLEVNCSVCTPLSHHVTIKQLAFDHGCLLPPPALKGYRTLTTLPPTWTMAESMMTNFFIRERKRKEDLIEREDDVAVHQTTSLTTIQRTRRERSGIRGRRGIRPGEPRTRSGHPAYKAATF
ncbi:hypothetical protein J6590_093475 [Homalodisca vitripennis]|nr:hypothetical protein J6590_093475 [Homalodisca vitripennis]